MTGTNCDHLKKLRTSIWTSFAILDEVYCYKSVADDCNTQIRPQLDLTGRKHDQLLQPAVPISILPKSMDRALVIFAMHRALTNMSPRKFAYVQPVKIPTLLKVSDAGICEQPVWLWLQIRPLYGAGLYETMLKNSLMRLRVKRRRVFCKERQFSHAVFHWNKVILESQKAFSTRR